MKDGKCNGLYCLELSVFSYQLLAVLSTLQEKNHKAQIIVKVLPIMMIQAIINKKKNTIFAIDSIFITLKPL